MLVNFYLTKRFFPHDITLIASVVGESVIGHNSGGIFIPAKWRDSLKASCWSKQQQKLCWGLYAGHDVPIGPYNRRTDRGLKYLFVEDTGSVFFPLP